MDAPRAHACAAAEARRRGVRMHAVRVTVSRTRRELSYRYFWRMGHSHDIVRRARGTALLLSLFAHRRDLSCSGTPSPLETDHGVSKVVLPSSTAPSASAARSRCSTPVQRTRRYERRAVPEAAPRLLLGVRDSDRPRRQDAADGAWGRYAGRPRETRAHAVPRAAQRELRGQQAASRRASARASRAPSLALLSAPALHPLSPPTAGQVVPACSAVVVLRRQRLWVVRTVDQLFFAHGSPCW